MRLIDAWPTFINPRRGDICRIALDQRNQLRTVGSTGSTGMKLHAKDVAAAMNDIAALLNRSDTTVAVVGATDNPHKYGSVIYRDLKHKGFTVYPVNPTRDTVDGDKAYASLAALPEKPTVVNIVVPPEATLQVLEGALHNGLTNVWVQPGAESPEVLAFLQEHGFNYLAHACIMIESRMMSG